MMDRVTWIEHKGKNILYIDYSGLNAKKDRELLLKIIEELKNQAFSKPTKSLFLSNVTDAYTDSFILSKLKDVAKFCTDNNLVEKECVVGLGGLKKTFIKIVNAFAQSKLVMFESVEEAKDWLVE